MRPKNKVGAANRLPKTPYAESGDTQFANLIAAFSDKLFMRLIRIGC
jgi:hypothetical protein